MTTSFSERLARINPQGQVPKTDNHQSHPTQDNASNTLESLRPWVWEDTPYGKARVYRACLGQKAPSSLPALHTLVGDDRLQGFEMNQALYLDIEATGLSHGAGTLAFLIGMSFWKGDELWLEQIFVDSPANEMACLSAFLKRLDMFPYLVSFNGKSYDLSVLQSRLVLNRLLSEDQSNIKLRPHLDLLHTARQAYRDVFENTRLQTLEREVLQLDPSVRADDVPGSLVPALYFHFLQTGLVSPLDGVLKHNHIDTTSLVSLTGHLLQLLRPGWENIHPQILYNLGRAALRRKLYDRAIHLLEEALGCQDNRLSVDTRQIALSLIVAYRRMGRSDKALNAALTAQRLTPPSDSTEIERLNRQIHRFQKQVNRLAQTTTHPQGLDRRPDDA